jgi:hypothetical protein
MRMRVTLSGYRGIHRVVVEVGNPVTGELCPYAEMVTRVRDLHSLMVLVTTYAQRALEEETDFFNAEALKEEVDKAVYDALSSVSEIQIIMEVEPF